MPIPIVQRYYLKYTYFISDDVFKNHLLLSARAFLFIFFLWKINHFYNKNKYIYIIAKIYAFSLMGSFLFSTDSMTMTRVGEFFGVVEIVLIPLLMYRLPRGLKYSVPFFWGLGLLIICAFLTGFFNNPAQVN
jgi:hypothetical protein